MNSNSRSIFRDALALVTASLVLEQLGLALLVFVLFVLWLRVPDETVLQLALSALLGLVMAALAGLAESRLILRLGGRSITTTRLIGGGLLVLVAAAIWFPFASWFDHLTWNDPVRAGYLNSQLPRGLRHYLSFERILLYLGWLWDAMAWMVAGVLAAAVFVITASGRRVRAGLLVLRSVSFWLMLIFGTGVAAVASGALMHWKPVHGLRPELVSLGVRLTAALVFRAVGACCLLAAVAVCVRRADAAYQASEATTSGGGPDASQPRTAEAP